MAKNKNVKWVNVGKLWKNPRNPDKLSGVIEIEHLGIKLNVYGFLKIGHQKRNPNEEDIRISMMVEELDEEENPF